MRTTVAWTLRVALAGVFLYAGAVKAGASQQFAIALAPFTFFPSEWIGVLAVALAWTEITAGLLLLAPKVHTWGAVVVIGLCLVFIGVLTWALMNGIIVACACFGEDETPSATKMFLAIGRDILLLSAASAILAIQRMGRRA
jgi:putative oxidoreductase